METETSSKPLTILTRFFNRFRTLFERFFMTMIRDNKIDFIIPDDSRETIYLLLNGEFYIKDHKVTLGQPSDVKNGDTLQCDSNGEFNFRVGRKKSKDVANWFNEKCDPSKNTTFGHPANELNFAFFGTLRLTLSHEWNKYEIVLDDILIAQGSEGTYNNWWFGGKTCTYVQHHKVVTNGSTTDKNNFKFTCYRGKEPDDHTVIIKNVEFLTWMNSVNQNKLLSEINIPGTHDSGTYNFFSPIVEDYVKTQNLSITEQLNLGIRFLDIRCRHINNTFAIHHGRFYCNLTFAKVLEQCISFLNENESETIVMLIKEEHVPKGNTREFYETFLDYVNKTSDFWYHKITIPTIKEARKKIVLMYRFDFEENFFGINCIGWKDNQTFELSNMYCKLMIQDQYSVSWKRKSRAIEELFEESEKREKYWYLNYISLATSSPVTIRTTSDAFNGFICRKAKNIRTGFLGIIIMDYPNHEKGLTSVIIDNNHFLSCV